MREILFRGKQVDNGEWVYGSLLKQAGEYISKDEVTPDECWICGMRGEKALIVSETIGQYTGLKDLHGTRIFEGDVVKSIAAWYVVEFENGGYGLRPFGKGKLIPIMGHGNFNENEVEVIGNVYDDVNLLEGEK